MGGDSAGTDHRLREAEARPYSRAAHNCCAAEQRARSTTDDPGTAIGGTAIGKPDTDVTSGDTAESAATGGAAETGEKHAADTRAENPEHGKQSTGCRANGTGGTSS